MSITMSVVSPRVNDPGRSWLGLPLQTLRQPEFEAACASLMRLVEADYAPTLIVGVRTGGLVVAETMARASAASPPVLPLTCRRASTNTKSLPLLRTILARLPRPLADLLRRLEHRWLTAPSAAHEQPREFDHAEASAIIELLDSAAEPPRVLVADDAVDSGATLATVMQALRGSGPPGTQVRSAAITQTTERPVLAPDYALHRGVLFRFPWSLDAR